MAVHVPGHHQRLLPVFPQVVGQLAQSGGLAGALEPHQHDYRRRIGRLVQLALGAPQELDELLMDDFHNILAWSEIGVNLLPHGPLLDLGGKFFDDLEVHIRIQQGQPDFPEGLFQILFGNRLLSPELLDGCRQFVG